MNLGRFDRKNREANEEAADIQKEVVHGVLSIVEEEGTVRIDLSGKIDASNYESIQTTCIKLLEKDTVNSFVFDMDKVTYVSSAGLRMFSAINRKCIELSKSYRLTQMSKSLFKMFQMTGYASAFTIDVKEE